MAREYRLTKKEKGFADDFLKTGNGTRSALANYDAKTENVAANIAYDNLRKPKIIEYMQEMSTVVANNIVRLATSAESEQVQLAAGKDVLDRAGYKPVDRSESKTLTVAVDVTTTPSELDAVREEFEKKLKDSFVK